MMMKPIQKEAADLKPKHDRLKVVLLDEVDKLIDAIEKKKPVSEIGQKVPEPITRELKSFHSSLSKVGKNMEKNMCTDISQIHFPVEMDDNLISKMILTHFYQNGCFTTAQLHAQKSNLAIDPSLTTVFQDLYLILNAFDQKNLKPARAWATKQSSEKTANIKYRLMRLEYLQLVYDSKNVETAVSYARENFKHYIAKEIQDIKMLMGCLVFVDRIDQSPYEDFLKHDHWDETREELIAIFCQLNGIPRHSALSVSMMAGLSGLEMLRKMYLALDRPNEWKTLPQLFAEVPLPEDFQFHSIFTCPVSKEETTVDNPPMLLKCGHVICKGCLDRLSNNQNGKRFKCPTCRVDQRDSVSKQVYF